MGEQRDEDDAAAAWDARYGAAEAPFGDAPSDTLSRLMARDDLRAALPPGSPVLCLADGDGRHGTWLARQGLAVTAVDVSSLAAQLAAARDRAAGVTVKRITADLAAWRPDPGSAQLVTLQFLQGPWALRRAALRAAGLALAPGGWLLVEGFAARDGRAVEEAPLGPSRDTHRWAKAEIDATLQALECLEDRIDTVTLSDGPRHSGRGLVLTALRRRRA